MMQKGILVSPVEPCARELEASGVGDGVQGKDLLLHMHLDQPDLSV